jgi:hypothetical protein
MRTIKFRALTSNKIYTHKDETYEKIWLYGSVVFNHDTAVIYPKNSNEGKFIEINTLEQYTGLKDKNGVEIYDGDKLSPYGAIVFWNEKFGAWSAHHVDDSDSWLLFTDDLKTIEVIGNIHTKESE